MVFEVLRAGLFGALQGVTEFWPVSSSGHLILLHAAFPEPLLDRLAFDVALHLGTFAATVWFFRKDLAAVARAFLRVIAGRGDGSPDERLGWALVLGTLPTVALALALHGYAEGTFRSVPLVAVLLIAGGVAFFLIERFAKRSREMATITWWDALLIGLAQGVAVIPGVSRSGISIIAGLGLGLKRDAAARFSFLLSVPVVFAAGVEEVGKYVAQGPSSGDLAPFTVGFIASTSIGFLALRFLIRFLGRASLIPFAWYRIAVGAAVLLALFLG